MTYDCELDYFAVIFCRYNFKMDSIAVPLLSPFNHVEWKLKMVAYIESCDLLDVSFRASK